MSCVVMNSEALAAIANAVETRLNCNYDFWGFEAPDSLYRELDDCKTSCTYFSEAIYRKLYSLNVRAYNGRYNGHEELEDEVAPTIDVNSYTVHHGPEYQKRGDGTGITFAVCQWHYQLAQLLDCWLYQTAENATCSDPLRLAMAEFRDDLYHFIVQHSPEYINGRWGQLPAPGITMKPTSADKRRELEHIKAYIGGACFDEQVCRDWLRRLWTAYCLRYDLDVDTSVYDNDLLSLWQKMEDTDNGGEPETADWSDYHSFDIFMSAYLC